MARRADRRVIALTFVIGGGGGSASNNDSGDGVAEWCNNDNSAQQFYSCSISLRGDRLLTTAYLYNRRPAP